MVESQSTKCAFTDEDRLSRLPDEILYCIYHGLQLKDAVRTSRVSTRYKTTWLEALAASAVPRGTRLHGPRLRRRQRTDAGAGRGHGDPLPHAP
jgi:hypothetical protein